MEIILALVHPSQILSWLLQPELLVVNILMAISICIWLCLVFRLHHNRELYVVMCVLILLLVPACIVVGRL